MLFLYKKQTILAWKNCIWNYTKSIKFYDAEFKKKPHRGITIDVIHRIFNWFIMNIIVKELPEIAKYVFLEIWLNNIEKQKIT